MRASLFETDASWGREATNLKKRTATLAAAARSRRSRRRGGTRACSRSARRRRPPPSWPAKESSRGHERGSVRGPSLSRRRSEGVSGARSVSRAARPFARARCISIVCVVAAAAPLGDGRHTCARAIAAAETSAGHVGGGGPAGPAGGCSTAPATPVGIRIAALPPTTMVAMADAAAVV